MSNHRRVIPKVLVKEPYPYFVANPAFQRRDRTAEHDEIERQTQEFLANKKNKIQLVPRRTDEETRQAFLERKAVISPGVYGQ